MMSYKKNLLQPVCKVNQIAGANVSFNKNIKQDSKVEKVNQYTKHCTINKKIKHTLPCAQKQIMLFFLRSLLR